MVRRHLKPYDGEDIAPALGSRRLVWGHGRATALVVVDMQKAFDDASWGRRNNPDCEGNVAD